MFETAVRHIYDKYLVLHCQAFWVKNKNVINIKLKKKNSNSKCLRIVQLKAKYFGIYEMLIKFSDKYLVKNSNFYDYTFQNFFYVIVKKNKKCC